MSFKIDFSPEAVEHLKNLATRERAIIFDQIEIQLAHEPDVETRRRKPLRSNPFFPWELRVGDLRVFYDVDIETEYVIVLAIGRKVRNRLLVAGEEVEL